MMRNKGKNMDSFSPNFRKCFKFYGVSLNLLFNLFHLSSFLTIYYWFKHFFFFHLFSLQIFINYYSKILNILFLQQMHVFKMKNQLKLKYFFHVTNISCTSLFYFRETLKKTVTHVVGIYICMIKKIS